MTRQVGILATDWPKQKPLREGCAARLESKLQLGEPQQGAPQLLENGHQIKETGIMLVLSLSWS